MPTFMILADMNWYIWVVLGRHFKPL